LDSGLETNKANLCEAQCGRCSRINAGTRVELQQTPCRAVLQHGPNAWSKTAFAGGSAPSLSCTAALRLRVTGRVGVHEAVGGARQTKTSGFSSCHSLLPAARAWSGTRGSTPAPTIRGRSISPHKSHVRPCGEGTIDLPFPQPAVLRESTAASISSFN
jgi:hypothetical protein